MTDNEIIKALECCKPKQNRNCGDCPAYDLGNFCAAELRENALDLINRQKKAEIEKLKSAKSEAIKEFADRLKEKDGYYNHIFDDCVNTEFCSHNYVKGRKEKSREIRKTIDNLVKEMVGEN